MSICALPISVRSRSSGPSKSFSLNTRFIFFFPISENLIYQSEYCVENSTVHSGQQTVQQSRNAHKQKTDPHILHDLRIHAESSLKNELVKKTVSVQRWNRQQIENCQAEINLSQHDKKLYCISQPVRGGMFV